MDAALIWRTSDLTVGLSVNGCRMTDHGLFCEFKASYGSVTSTTRKPRSVSVSNGPALSKDRSADRQDCWVLSKAPPRVTFRPLRLEAGPVGSV
jgi:hypothetical protein